MVERGAAARVVVVRAAETAVEEVARVEATMVVAATVVRDTAAAETVAVAMEAVVKAAGKAVEATLEAYFGVLTAVARLTVAQGSTGAAEAAAPGGVRTMHRG